jgi:hypothetical protein
MQQWVKPFVGARLMSQTDRNNAALLELRAHQLVLMPTKKFVKKPRIFGVVLCWTCFASLHGMSYQTMARLRQLTLAGETHWQHKGGAENRHAAPKKDDVTAFIDWLKTNFGEFLPDRKKTELPPDTKQNHYLNFATEQLHKGCPGCTYEYFCQIWKKDFKDLILPENPRWVTAISTLFSTCFR